MSDIEARILQVRQAIVDTIDQLVAKVEEFELASPPETLPVCRNRLADDRYQVLVAGEVKRGKSSFINALIGQPVLPTDVDVATSQVFRIRRAEQEAYRLRFEDGSAKSIERNDLPRYGSQVIADAEGTPRLDQIIRWIEIDVPVRFLPLGVDILDTPGLGGLYELHAEITQRFIPQSDAVVFVLDSSRPIIEEELNYLAGILSATKNVFFIQTKIDQFRSQQWRDVLRRNHDILRERFGDQLIDCRVWPISSKLLSAAATNQDPDFEIASMHQELAPAFKGFLFRASGWTRAADTLIVASDFHHQSSAVLRARRRAVEEESQQGRDDLHRQLAERNERFIGDWGPRGKLRRELTKGIEKIVVIGRGRVNQLLARGGELESKLQRKVAAAESFDQLSSVSDRLASDASAHAMRVWREVSEQSWRQCQELLAPFVQAVEEVALPNVDVDATGLSAERLAPDLSRDWYAKLKGARFDLMTGAWAGGTGVAVGGGLLVALGVLTAPIVAPLAAIGAIVGGLWAVIRGTKNVDQSQLRSAKQDISRYVSDLCQEVREHFFEVDFDGGSFSPVDQFFNEMTRITEEVVDSTVKQKETETEAEIARLKRDAQLSAEMRKVEAERIAGMIVTWNTLGKTLQLASEELRRLDQDIAGPSSSLAASSGDVRERHAEQPQTAAR